MKALWGAVLVTLVGVLIIQWWQWPPQPSWRLSEPMPGAGAARADNAQSALLEDLDILRDRAAYAEVIERPLFMPDRRPPEPEETLEEEPEPVVELTPVDKLDLIAVIMTPDLTTAWVRVPDRPRPLKVRPGEDVAGWSAKEIRADRLVLERQGMSDTVLLLRNYSAPSGPVQTNPRAERPTPARAARPAQRRQGPPPER
jgi:hypothetical protein